MKRTIEEKAFIALKGILILLTTVIFLMLIPSIPNALQKNSECIKQGYNGFAEQENGITYCYKNADPTDPLYQEHLKALGLDLPVYVYSIDGQLKESYNAG